MIEIWKDIPGYEGMYEASNLGNIKSLNYNHTKKEKILKVRLDKRGYEVLDLRNKGKKRFHRVHRLVAQAFIPNPNNFPQVNHKDENKRNNNVNNLEWCTNDYNAHYGTRYKRIKEKLCKKVLQYDLDNRLIASFKSISEARQSIGTTHISDVCNGKRKTAGGYIWKYA